MKDLEKDIWVFMSHSYKDFNKVRLIRNYLEEKSFRPLLFYLKCLDSEEAFNLVKREIDVRTRFILCDSENARSSEWVKKEMDYISNALPKRTYEVLDISKPLEQLKPVLDKYICQANVYISYSLHKPYFDNILKRLSKYDIRVSYPEKDGYLMDASGDQVVNKGLPLLANYGFYILLADDVSILSTWVIRELEQAVALKKKILVFALTEDVYKWFLKNKKNLHKNIIRVEENSKDSYTAGVIADRILSRVLTPGAIVTHGDNFRTGRNAPVDINEAEHLNEVLLRIAKESSNTEINSFIADSYTKGLHGFNKDLIKASEYKLNSITSVLLRNEKKIPKNNYKINETIKTTGLVMGDSMIDGNFKKMDSIKSRRLANHGRHK